MTDPSAAPVWRPVEYDDAWTPFNAAFGFRPDYHEPARPAIRLPDANVVLDLTAVFGSDRAGFAAGGASINASALRCFVSLVGEGELIALDWQHPSYRWSPAPHAIAALAWPVPVFPDGDYYIHTTPDLRWGTFGHPWQQSLSIWGAELVDSLGAELSTWLPVREP